MKVRIYHNPRCSKSRATLALLEDRDLELEVVHYLETPPSKEKLRELLAKLGIPARDLIRSKEPEFEASGLTLSADEDQLLELMLRAPKLIERPIVETGAQARIGRPPEQVLDILQ